MCFERRHTIIQLFKIHTWVRKVKNYRTTKKRFCELSHRLKTFFTPIPKKIHVSFQKFYTASKFFTPSWIALIAAYSMSDIKLLISVSCLWTICCLVVAKVGVTSNLFTIICSKYVQSTLG